MIGDDPFWTDPVMTVSLSFKGVTASVSLSLQGDIYKPIRAPAVDDTYSLIDFYSLAFERKSPQIVKQVFQAHSEFVIGLGYAESDFRRSSG
jgi:hypothetical protein